MRLEKDVLSKLQEAKKENKSFVLSLLRKLLKEVNLPLFPTIHERRSGVDRRLRYANT